MWTSSDLETLLGFPLGRKFTFEFLGFADSSFPQTLTFAENHAFLELALGNRNIVAVITTKELADIFPKDDKLIFSRNPQYIFFRFHNEFALKSVSRKPTLIDQSSQISSSARISPINVKIGAGVVIEDNCVIHEGTEIGACSVVRSGSTLGSSAIYVVRGESEQRFLAEHVGSVSIGERVDIGCNSVIDKGIFLQESTLISSDNFIGPLSNISHAVEIQSGNTIAAGVKISGYSRIGSDNWIGPGALLSHRIKVGSKNHIALGSTLLKSIGDNHKVVGNRIFSDRTLF